MIFAIENGQFYYEDNLILQDICVSVEKGERIGIIGENGAGKTTLLNLIIGKLSLDEGEIFVRKNLAIGYLEQNGGLESENTVLEEMRLVFGDLLSLENKMRALEQMLPTFKEDSVEYRKCATEYSEAKKRFEGLDGYNVDVKIKTVLNGMGFLGLYERKCSTFSGGEKTRLAICKLLLQEPDLLILDEPTNHLDFKTLFWLENHLKNYKGAILMVSHDRYFLDELSNKTWEIKNCKLKEYKGNYTRYKELKAEWAKTAQKEFDKQQVEIAKMEDYVARNLVRATTSKSAKSRVKKLEKMERLEKPDLSENIPVFSFEKGLDPTKDVLKVVDLELFAGEKKLINCGNFTVKRGEKVAIIGENGTGKSTLLKSVINSFGKYEKNIVFGKNVFLSYYDQENSNLNFENQVRLEMWDKFPKATEFGIRRALGRMLFSDEDMEKKISVLSGGERARLGFALMTMKSANFLIFDEPTNHVDLPTRESLEKALKEFDGTVLFVSHDRYFLSSLATKVVEIVDCNLQENEMGFSEYLKAKEAEKAKLEQERIDLEKEKAKTEQKSTYRGAKERAEEVKRRQQLKAAEEEIEKLELRNLEISSCMQTEEVASDYSKLKPLLDEMEQNKIKLDNLYLIWENLT